GHARRSPPCRGFHEPRPGAHPGRALAAGVARPRARAREDAAQGPAHEPPARTERGQARETGGLPTGEPPAALDRVGRRALQLLFIAAISSRVGPYMPGGTPPASRVSSTSCPR